MKNWGKEKIEETEHIRPATWAKYFGPLLNKNENNKQK